MLMEPSARSSMRTRYCRNRGWRVRSFSTLLLLKEMGGWLSGSIQILTNRLAFPFSIYYYCVFFFFIPCLLLLLLFFTARLLSLGLCMLSFYFIFLFCFSALQTVIIWAFTCGFLFCFSPLRLLLLGLLMFFLLSIFLPSKLYQLDDCIYIAWSHYCACILSFKNLSVATWSVVAYTRPPCYIE